MDWTTLLPLLQPVALAVAGVTLPGIAILLGKAVGVAVTAQKATELSSAVIEAAQGMYTHYVANKQTLGNSSAFNDALKDGVNHVMEVVPGAVSHLGYDESHVAGMVSRRFGAVLATDPTISIAAAPPPA